MKAIVTVILVVGAGLAPPLAAALDFRARLILEAGARAETHVRDPPLPLNEEGYALPTFEDFLPTCLGHVNELVDAVDSRLGQAGRVHPLSEPGGELRKELELGCMRNRSFPGGFEDGLVHTKACREFSEYIAGARVAELRGRGTEQGYRDFCANYYALLGGTLPTSSPEADAIAVQSAPPASEVQNAPPASQEPGYFHGAWERAAGLWTRHWRLFVGALILLLCLACCCKSVFFCCLPHELQVEVIRAQGLRNSDRVGFGKSDPYCILTFNGKTSSEQRTKVINDTLDPVWGETLSLKGYQAGDTLEIQVMDKATWHIRNDQVLGLVRLPVARMALGFEGELQLTDPQGRANAGKLWVKVAALGATLSRERARSNVSSSTRSARRSTM